MPDIDILQCLRRCVLEVLDPRRLVICRFHALWRRRKIPPSTKPCFQEVEGLFNGVQMW